MPFTVLQCVNKDIIIIISQKNVGGIVFLDPQQFSELENVGTLGAGGGVHGEVSWPID